VAVGLPESVDTRFSEPANVYWQSTLGLYGLCKLCPYFRKNYDRVGFRGIAQSSNMAAHVEAAGRNLDNGLFPVRCGYDER
jgi:hypothetical protein